jgi:hypothetical protein
MSIYPVPLANWFPNPAHRKYSSFVEYEQSLNDYDTVRFLVSITKCFKCGKHCKYNRAWGHHSIFVGHGDIWCSRKCMRSRVPVKKRRERTSRWKRIKYKDFFNIQKFMEDNRGLIEDLSK